MVIGILYIFTFNMNTHSSPPLIRQLTLEGEQVVASDDVKTSSYHVKNALDANFSYSPPPKEQHKVEEDDIDEPDIGVGRTSVCVCVCVCMCMESVHVCVHVHGEEWACECMYCSCDGQTQF